jgi:hypothetical protein
MGMPISDVVPSPMKPTLSDMAIFGSSVARMSSVALDYFIPGYSNHYNCCISNLPHGMSVPEAMCYSTGLISKPLVSPYPCIDKRYRHSPRGHVVYHLGGSRKDKEVIMSGPISDGASIVVGSPDDPCPDWVDEDARGCSLSSSVDYLCSAVACVGSDSLITNLSSLIGVPTVSVHYSQNSIVSSNRSMYGNHACSVLSKRGVDSRMIVISELSRFFIS